jgi:hypothetical protein
MPRLIERIFQWLQGETLKLLIFAGVLLLVWGAVSPVGTLVWWLEQGSPSLRLKNNQTKNLPENNRSNKIPQSGKVHCYIVFLPGVGDFSANQLFPGEEIFLDRLEKSHPNCDTVRDVFPYSAANQGLGRQRLLAPLWRAAKEADGWLSNIRILINIRNTWRFAISADERYGPVYNRGIATAIIERANAAHPLPQLDEKVKIILIGHSGGVQVALGAAPYLEQWLNATLIVVSIGGAFDGENGFATVDHVYHLRGRQDWIEDIPRIVFAARWYWTLTSPFNQARRQGRYTVVNTGPHAHNGPFGYFGRAFVGDSKITYVDLTLQKVNQLPIWSER